MTYKDRAAFYLIYIREAHPDSTVYAGQGDKKVLVKIPQTNTLDERRKTAAQCTAALKLSMPTLVDREDNKVNRTYAGWPDRLYIIGSDGLIAYQGGPGPGGFRPQDVAAWLKKNAGK